MGDLGILAYREYINLCSVYFNLPLKIFSVAAHIVPMEDFIWKPLLQNSAKYKLHKSLYEIRQCKLTDTCMRIYNLKIKKNIKS